MIFLSIKYYVLLGDMEKEYAIGIDLGGTSVKYALIDNEGVFYFQGKLPSKADVSAEAVIGQLVTAINEVKAFAQEQEIGRASCRERV